VSFVVSLCPLWLKNGFRPQNPLESEIIYPRTLGFGLPRAETDPNLPDLSIPPGAGMGSARPEIFRNFFLRKQLSQTVDESAARQTVRVHLRSSAAHNGKVVPHMQTPENIWPGTYSVTKL